MNAQIAALQEQLAAQQLAQQAAQQANQNQEEIRNLKLYQSAVRGIPMFSGEKGQGWRYHRIALENWYASNRLDIYATPIQQKQAILLSLKGPA